MIRLILLPLLLIAAMGQPLNAAIDAYPFPEEEMRVRYNALIDELRCPLCLNTNLAGSDSIISKDLRREVHRLVLEGKNDDEVLEFMHSRYGDFILYKPRLTSKTMVLWFGPLLLLILALFVGFRVARNKAPVVAISPEEQDRIDKLISTNRKDT